MTIRNTMTLDVNKKVTRHLNDLLDIADEDNLKIYKVALYRSGLDILYNEVMSNENKRQTLNRMVLEHDKRR